ncbi:MAG: hypothetical protein ACK4NX_03160 [Candidatus Paceibacteria bacterium]
MFETIEFQKKLKAKFESRTFLEIFEKAGTQVAHIDASKSVAETQRQAVAALEAFLSSVKFSKLKTI